jgi:hypothetical protein
MIGKLATRKACLIKVIELKLFISFQRYLHTHLDKVPIHVCVPTTVEFIILNQISNDAKSGYITYVAISRVRSPVTR